MLLDDDKMNKRLVDIDDDPATTTGMASPAAGPSNVVAATAASTTTLQGPGSSNLKGGIDFADSNYFVPPGGEAPPPDFAPYAADYFETSDGSIVSHDPHLNQDGTLQFPHCVSPLTDLRNLCCRRGSVPVPALPIACSAPAAAARPRTARRAPLPLCAPDRRPRALALAHGDRDHQRRRL